MKFSWNPTVHISEEFIIHNNSRGGGEWAFTLHLIYIAWKEGRTTSLFTPEQCQIGRKHYA